MDSEKRELPIPLRNLKRAVGLGFYGLLLALFFNSLAMTLRPGLTSAVIWLLESVPLLIFIPGLLKTRLRTFAWLSFVSLMYFIHGVLLAFSPERMWIGLMESLCSIGLFIALLLFIRNYRQHFQVSV